MSDTRKPLWSTIDLARYLGVSLHTIYRWRMDGRGPKGIKVGNSLRYRAEDVDRWLETRESR